MSIQIYSIQVFVTFVESKNIFEAAQKLAISQPSVSLHLKYLEDYYQTKLFGLSGKKKILNSRGKTLYNNFAPHIHNLKSISEDMNKELKDPNSLKIKVAGRKELFKLLKINDSFGGSIHYLSLPSSEALAQLLKGEIDFAIAHSIPNSSEITAKELFSNTMCFYIPKSLVEKKPSLKNLKSLDFLRSIPFINYGINSTPMTEWLKSTQTTNQKLHAKITIEDWNEISELVQSGLGFTLGPSNMKVNIEDVYKISLPSNLMSSKKFYLLQRLDSKSIIPTKSIFHL